MGNEIVQFVKKNWLALIAVLILIPLAVGLGIKYIDYVPLLKNIPGEKEDWLGFWSGYLGSIVGIGGAYYVMKHQLNVENKKEQKDKEPLLVPGTAQYTNLLLTNGKDMVNDGKWFKDLKEFSEASFPLVNGGITPVFDIKYCYTIENIEEYKEIFTKESMISEMSPKMYIRTRTDGTDVIHYYHDYEDDNGKEGSRWVQKSNLNYLDFSPVIMPGESINIKLPITAIILLSYSFSNFFLYEKFKGKEIILPELTLSISYKDYQLEEKTIEFDMRVQGYNTNFENGEFRIVPTNLKPENLRP